MLREAEAPALRTALDPLRVSVEALARVHADMARGLAGSEHERVVARMGETLRALTALLDGPLAMRGIDGLAGSRASGPPPIVLVVDADAQWRDAAITMLAARGQPARGFANGAELLSDYRGRREACIVIGPSAAQTDGCAALYPLFPAIVVTGAGNVSGAVAAIKAGAAEAIEAPAPSDLVAAIARALGNARDSRARLLWQEDAARRIAALTPRQRQVLHFVIAGLANKNIARELGISQRSVENHRAQIMRRTGSKSLAALARLALAASARESADPSGTRAA
jgi:two-component system CheB/CheR fusion protein